MEEELVQIDRLLDYEKWGTFEFRKLKHGKSWDKGTVPVSRRSENMLIRETAEPSLCLSRSSYTEEWGFLRTFTIVIRNIVRRCMSREMVTTSNPDNRCYRIINGGIRIE